MNPYENCPIFENGNYLLRLVGMAEPVYERKSRKLEIRNIWYEQEGKLTKTLAESVEKAAGRLERFCISI